jgi:curved DNA-binding protein CbpA
MNPYKELDVSITATTEEIKQRYRVLAQLHHPDKGGDEETFKRIKEAYEILIDPLRRRNFDQTGDYSPTADLTSEAFSKLSEFLQQLINRIDPDKDDLLFLLRKNIQDLHTESHRNQILANKYIKNLETIKSKIKVKSEETENILSQFVEKELEARRTEYRMFTHNMKLCDHMTNILLDYKYILQELLSN